MLGVKIIRFSVFRWLDSERVSVGVILWMGRVEWLSRAILVVDTCHAMEFYGMEREIGERLSVRVHIFSAFPQAPGRRGKIFSESEFNVN